MFSGLAMVNSALELEMFVSVGFSPLDAIVAGTRNSAEALGLEDKIGTIEPGKYADIIVVSENPLDDITVLRKEECIKLVMKDGEIHINRGLK